MTGKTETDHEAQPLPFSHPVAVAGLSRAEPTPVAVVPGAKEATALAAALGVVAVRETALKGRIAPWGSAGWRLEARLTANVEQRCVVTLEPVMTSLDLAVERRFLPEGDPALADPEEADGLVENADETAPEPVGVAIELAAILLEAIALELDPWPRAEGATFGSRVHGPPGADPMTDEAMRPFAGLASLRNRLKPSSGGTES